LPFSAMPGTPWIWSCHRDSLQNHDSPVLHHLVPDSVAFAAAHNCHIF